MSQEVYRDQTLVSPNGSEFMAVLNHRLTTTVPVDQNSNILDMAHNKNRQERASNLQNFVQSSLDRFNNDIANPIAVSVDATTLFVRATNDVKIPSDLPEGNHIMSFNLQKGANPILFEAIKEPITVDMPVPDSIKYLPKGRNGCPTHQKVYYVNLEDGGFMGVSVTTKGKTFFGSMENLDSGYIGTLEEKGMTRRVNWILETFPELGIMTRNEGKSTEIYMLNRNILEAVTQGNSVGGDATIVYFNMNYSDEKFGTLYGTVTHKGASEVITE
jgi:hypothetical protein